MSKLKNNWKTLSSKIVHKNPWYRIKKDSVIFPNGKEGEYYIVQTGKSAFVVPVRNNCIVFIKQYRYVFDEWFLELPGGGVEESPRDSAARELREEVGLQAKDLEEIGTFVPFSGVVEEVSHVFIAKNLCEVGQELEAGESGAEVIDIPIDEVYEMIEDNQINDGQTVTSLMIARKHLVG